MSSAYEIDAISTMLGWTMTWRAGGVRLLLLQTYRLDFC